MARSAAKKKPAYPPGESPQEKLDAAARRTYSMSAEEFVRALDAGEFDDKYSRNDPDFFRVFELMGPYLDATQDTRVISLTPEQARQHFEEQAQHWLGMTGDEFVRKWEAGEFGDFDRNAELRGKVWPVAMLLPWY